MIIMAERFRSSFRQLTVLSIVFILFYLETIECKKRKTKQKKPSASETNVFNFFRLFVMRLVYGFANMIGAGEAMEDFLGGIFVPPAVEDSDYKDYLDDDKDDDYFY